MEKICLGVCIVLNVITSIQAMTCSGRTHIVPPSEVGKHLEGSILKTIENVGHNDCFDECIRRVSCKSLNFQKDQLTCELNTAVGTVSGDYTVNVNYDYTSMAGQRQTINDPCWNIVCGPSTKCFTNRSGTKSCLNDV